MAEGKLTIGMNKKEIDGILVEGEIMDPSHGILELNKWALPHWDWLVTAKIGSVKVNQKTAEYLINRLKEVLPGQEQHVMMVWLNYGWSIDEKLPDWKCILDFSKLEYKE